MVSTGFTINYSILPQKSFCSSLEIAPCSGSGSCVDRECYCDPGYGGMLCQLQSTPFSNYTAREMHAVAYEPTRDIMIMTFGVDWKSWYPLSDIFVYEFRSKSWSSIPKPDTMMARFNHHQWLLNQNTMILFGGQIDAQTPRNDIFSLDLATMSWTQIIKSAYSLSAPYLIGPASILVPDKGNTSFSIYVFGGLDEHGDCNFKLFKFSSVTISWTIVGNGPVCYQEGTGVYNSHTNSIRFFGGFPAYDTSFDASYTFEYSIDSNWWSWTAPRDKSAMLFGVQALIDSENEIAILHGGVNVGGLYDCYLKTIWILDLACNTWTSFTPPSNVHRVNHGIVYRNHSLFIIGGSDGIMHNDILEVPLTSDLLLSSSSLKERDNCRAMNYCSQINDCSLCSLSNLCQWCNGACGFDQSSNPLVTTIGSSKNDSSLGSLDTGVCPSSLAIGDSKSSPICPPRKLRYFFARLITHFSNRYIPARTIEFQRKRFFSAIPRLLSLPRTRVWRLCDYSGFVRYLYSRRLVDNVFC